MHGSGWRPARRGTLESAREQSVTVRLVRTLSTDDEHRDIETYDYVAERLVDSCAGGGSTAEPDRRLDYVFVPGETVEVVVAGAWEGRKAGDMDHDPVVVELRLR